ncbi:putative beta-barrel protein YwiB [Geobacillus sp. TFV-3]|nr:putative beta-barrel protein YwiB [Geobacillus sp. TFV-3]
MVFLNLRNTVVKPHFLIKSPAFSALEPFACQPGQNRPSVLSPLEWGGTVLYTINYDCFARKGVLIKMKETNGIPVSLRQVTVIRDGARQETVVLEADGMYYIKGKAGYLQFEEENELGRVKTTVKIAPEEVAVIRSGAVEMRQTFRRRQETPGHYRTAFGRWALAAKTSAIEFHYDEQRKKGRLFLSYELTLGDERSGRHTLTLTFKGV